MSLAVRNVRASLSLLAILYVSVLLAGFLTPYAPTEQNRDMPFAPPTRLHFAEATGRVHLRPFVYRLASDPRSFDYIVAGGGTAGAEGGGASKSEGKTEGKAGDGASTPAAPTGGESKAAPSQSDTKSSSSARGEGKSSKKKR